MARALWSGAIAFGLVNIPVKLYGATESKDLSFTTLHSSCMTALRRPYVCPKDNVPVESKDMVKGYEYAKGQYVILTDKDFDAVPLEASKALEVQGFVESEDISPILRERNYYLGPEESRAGRPVEEGAARLDQPAERQPRPHDPDVPG